MYSSEEKTAKGAKKMRFQKSETKKISVTQSYEAIKFAWIKSENIKTRIDSLLVFAQSLKCAEGFAEGK